MSIDFKTYLGRIFYNGKKSEAIAKLKKWNRELASYFDLEALLITPTDLDTQLSALPSKERLRYRRWYNGVTTYSIQASAARLRARAPAPLPTQSAAEPTDEHVPPLPSAGLANAAQEPPVTRGPKRQTVVQNDASDSSSHRSATPEGLCIFDIDKTLPLKDNKPVTARGCNVDPKSALLIPSHDGRASFEATYARKAINTCLSRGWHVALATARPALTQPDIRALVQLGFPTSLFRCVKIQRGHGCPNQPSCQACAIQYGDTKSKKKAFENLLKHFSQVALRIRPHLLHCAVHFDDKQTHRQRAKAAGILGIDVDAQCGIQQNDLAHATAFLDFCTSQEHEY